MGEFYLGLMSGTSLDGVDAALVALDSGKLRVHRTATTPSLTGASRPATLGDVYYGVHR